MNRRSDINALPIIAAPLSPHVGGAQSSRLATILCWPCCAVARLAKRSVLYLEAMQMWMEDDGQAADIYRKFLLGDAVGRLQFGNHVSRTAKKPGFCLLFLRAGRVVCLFCAEGKICSFYCGFLKPLLSDELRIRFSFRINGIACQQQTNGDRKAGSIPPRAMKLQFSIRHTSQTAVAFFVIFSLNITEGLNTKTCPSLANGLPPDVWVGVDSDSLAIQSIYRRCCMLRIGFPKNGEPDR